MAPRRNPEVVIIGAGIVGAAAAYCLAAEGITDVVILEQEDMPNRHSSGRNASYYLPVYDTPVLSALAQASIGFFREPPDGFSETGLIEQRGAVIGATEGDAPALAAEIDGAQGSGVPVEAISPGQAGALVPILRTDWLVSAAFYPGAGPLDVHAISTGYLRAARRAGVELRTSESVLAIRSEAGRVTGVETSSGFVSCRWVVNAAGAWAGDIGRLAGARDIVFTPKRRHIVSLPLGPDLAGRTWPFFRAPALPLYMKPDGAQLLASRMDASPDEPGDCMSDDEEIAAVADAVAAHTTLPVRRITRAWAGHRTFAPDDAPVVGRDPVLDGFVWAAGLGGAGVMTSPVIGRIVADAIRGEAQSEIAESIAPRRPSILAQ